MLVATLMLGLSVNALAATLDFTDTVRVVMGSRESQDEVRVYATQEAKRRVLDKVGVYLSGSTEIVRKVEEATYLPRRHEGDTNKNFESSWFDSSSVLQTIQTLTVGVVQTEVVSEEWKSEGGSFVLYLVCRVTVDREDALARLTELLKDKQKVEDYQKVQEEVERLRGDLAQLRLDLESAKTEKEKVAVKEEVQEKINGLTAIDWFEKGLAAEEMDDKIACYSIALQIDVNYVSAYANRGIVYVIKKEFDHAFTDFNNALRLEPNHPQSIAGFGLIHYANKNYWRAIQDFSLALQLDPDNAQAYYYIRAYAYEFNGDTLEAIQDFERAADLGNEDAKHELEELR